MSVAQLVCDLQCSLALQEPMALKACFNLSLYANLYA